MNVTNPWEVQARGIKARKLARWLLVHVVRGRGFTADEIAGISGESRLIIARLAKVKPPSDATWAEVVELLRRET